MTAEDGVTGVAALNDLLDAYRTPPGSRATILEAVAAVQAEGMTVVGRTPDGGSVSLSPADGLAAVVVRPDRVRLALDRRVAVRVAREHEFCRLDEAGSAGGRLHLVLEHWALAQHAVAVRTLIVTALRLSVLRPAAPRSAQARGVKVSGAQPAASTRSRGSRPLEPAPAARPAVCPVHFVQLINGHCDYCD